MTSVLAAPSTIAQDLAPILFDGYELGQASQCRHPVARITNDRFTVHSLGTPLQEPSKLQQHLPDPADSSEQHLLRKAPPSPAASVRSAR